MENVSKILNVTYVYEHVSSAYKDFGVCDGNLAIETSYGDSWNVSWGTEKSVFFVHLPGFEVVIYVSSLGSETSFSLATEKEILFSFLLVTGKEMLFSFSLVILFSWMTQLVFLIASCFVSEIFFCSAIQT